MSESSLEARLRRLEDIEALRVLKARYAEICDEGFDPDLLAALFTSDAVWDGGKLGRVEGREAIRSFFAGASKAMSFAIHHVGNPILEVEGDQATGRWHLWQPSIFGKAKQALWIAGRYREKYRREDGVWRIAELIFRVTMMSPYEDGWSKTRVLGEQA